MIDAASGQRVGAAEIAVVRRGLEILAGHCDGARRRDETGFSASDVEIGNSLLAQKVWTPRQALVARKIVERYKNTQLAGIAFPPIELFELAAAEQGKPGAPVHAGGAPQDPLVITGKLVDEATGPALYLAASRFHAPFVEAVKLVPGRRYAPDTKQWRLDVAAAPQQVMALVEKFSVRLGDDDRNRLAAVIDDLASRSELSRAASIDDAGLDLVIPGGLDLYPFQKAGVAYALRARNVLIADQMGLGKTPTSLVTLATSGSFPAVVICPASLKRNWEREANKWLPGKKVAVLNGNVFPLCGLDGTPAYDVVIVNYNSRILEKWLDWLHVFQPRAIVLDEAHNVKNPSAKQTKLVLELCKRLPQARRILLTGTPVVNRPMEFWTLVRILGYQKIFGGYHAYRARYDTSYQNRLTELNEKARAHFMVRRTKDEVLKELPAKQRTIVPVEITNRAEYEKAERDAAEWFANRRVDTSGIDQMVYEFARRENVPDHLVPELLRQARERIFAEAYSVAARAEQLVRWEALKRTAVEGKLPEVKAWIENFLESGDEQLVIFAIHTDVIDRLADWFGAETIQGSTPVDARMGIVDRFQRGERRVIVGNMQAMGEGLTLTAASNVCFVEFGWNPKSHDQAEDRCHRIGQKDAVMVWNLAAEGTVDEELIRLIDKKRGIVDAMTDGRVSDGTDADIVAGIGEYLAEKYRRG
jgi:SNF2 family DNA or RNA helicase